MPEKRYIFEVPLMKDKDGNVKPRVPKSYGYSVYDLRDFNEGKVKILVSKGLLHYYKNTLYAHYVQDIRNKQNADFFPLQ